TGSLPLANRRPDVMRRLTGAREVSDRYMPFVGHPDRGEIAALGMSFVPPYSCLSCRAAEMIGVKGALQGSSRSERRASPSVSRLLFAERVGKLSLVHQGSRTNWTGGIANWLILRFVPLQLDPLLGRVRRARSLDV